MGTSRTICVALFAMTLAGCGIAARIEAEKQAKERAAQMHELVEQSKAAVADCNVNFPKGNPKIEVARVKCLNDAMIIRMPTFGTDQDLARVYLADRAMIAERIQSGKMTLAEADAALAEKWSALVSESKQRANARGSVIAQRNMAAAQQQAADAANTAAWASMIEATKPPPMAPPPTPVINPTITCFHPPGSPFSTCN